MEYQNLYHSYYGYSHVIKVIISLLNFLGIRHHPSATFFFVSRKPVRAPYCNYGINELYHGNIGIIER